MKDYEILRDLAEKYLEICNEDIQEERRRLWRKQNSLDSERPLIYARAFAWKEMPDSKLKCEDEFFRDFEGVLRKKLFWHSLNDDSIFEPWIDMSAVHKCRKWGISSSLSYSDDPAGSYKEDYPIKELEDIKKMLVPWHEIDEEATERNLSRLSDTVGDLIEINVLRGSPYTMFAGDISTDLGHLRGIENIMLDMMDNPEWFHELLAFMRDGILKAHEEAEKAGDWGLSDHQNQAMPYAKELKDPAPNKRGVKRKDLWFYMASQEYTLISPEMQEEFLFRYQYPILEKFGLTAYGCCEDLTNKISMIKKLPNLRRIGVSPFANVAKCAEQIGADYVLSYRPSPADMVSYGFDKEKAKGIMKRDLEICKANGCNTDITLKDVETVEGDPDRVRKWVQAAREAINEVW